MKKAIKMIIILGIVVSFFPAYTMKNSYSHLVKKGKSKHKNLFLHPNNFWIKTSDGWQAIPDDNPIYIDKDLASVLAAGTTLLMKLDSTRKKETLETVRNAVGGGTSLTCNYIVEPNRGYSFRICIQPSKSPTSIFQSIENSFGSADLNKKSDDETLLIKAVIQGYDDREKNFTCTSNVLTDSTRSELSIELPKELAGLIAQYLSECCTSAEDAKLVEQAKKKLGEAEQKKCNLSEEK